MGGNGSKKSDSTNKNVPTATASEPPRGKRPSKLKHVLLLYKAESNDEQELVAAFSRALINAGPGQIDIDHKVNIAEVDPSSIEDLDWLNQVNNVILIRLSFDIIADLERIIRDKRFTDNGVLHDKIVAVSFGKKLSAGWPPSGVERPPRADKKDFWFGFEDESALSRKDFKSHSAEKTLNDILIALKAEHSREA